VIPTVILSVLLGFENGYGLDFWFGIVPIITVTWGLMGFLTVFYTLRYYIKELRLTDNGLEIIYYKYGSKQHITLTKDEIYLRLTDYRDKRKNFEIVKGDVVIIKQAPYLEWEENLPIIKLLEDNGFTVRTYW